MSNWKYKSEEERHDDLNHFQNALSKMLAKLFNDERHYCQCSADEEVANDGCCSCGYTGGKFIYNIMVERGLLPHDPAWAAQGKQEAQG